MHVNNVATVEEDKCVGNKSDVKERVGPALERVGDEEPSHD
eukprot:CAMPEP_0185760962 /NCGR_PEP_ID=MMETSP1174-20130828/19867_1 /TAXON_ID=35687 /ORGANISM="Dictyocha speculum, Strain CCMP1381" /LENGTH=40 /DNA_ID= /DNA_START= /DNA_END= /DNA_ORIENTATION=